MHFVFCHVHILHPERKRLPNTDRRFIEQSDQEVIPLLETSIKELLHLIFRDGFGALPFRLWLFEDIFLDRGSFGKVMQERFVPSGAGRKKGRRLVFDIGSGFFHAPVVVVKAPHYRECMIDSPVGTQLGYWMDWQNLEGAGGHLEPEDKTRESIQSHLLPVEALLGKVLPIVLERVSIRAECLTSRANTIKVLQVAYNRLDKHACIINDDIAFLVILCLNLHHTHLPRPSTSTAS